MECGIESNHIELCHSGLNGNRGEWPLEGIGECWPVGRLDALLAAWTLTSAMSPQQRTLPIRWPVYCVLIGIGQSVLPAEYV
jgi:hypothetical protein